MTKEETKKLLKDIEELQILDYKLTRDDLIENFLNSNEFKALVQKYQISIK